MKTLHTLRRRTQRGIAMLEAMIAVVILGIGLVGTVALQARSYSAISDAGMRAEATLAAEKLLGVISTDMVDAASYALAAGGTPSDQLKPWVDETQKSIPGAAIIVGVTNQPDQNRYQIEITISWHRKANSAVNQHHVIAYIAS